MANPLRVFGAELSPFSVKVRSYFRYKAIAHEWILRNPSSQAEFEKYAKLPLVPLVVTPEGEGLQDSTPIIERFEATYPEPSIHPPDPVSAFVSTLIEEFGDEWGNKWMFHYRWARTVDQDSASTRLARLMMPDLEDTQYSEIAAQIKQRMVLRVGFVGSSAQTAAQIEASFRETVVQLESHLATRPYLFGARPAFGDFGLWGQIYNTYTDPTCHKILAPFGAVVGWIQRMLEPEAEGAFESWDTLAPTMMPLLEKQVGRLFLPWSHANATALANGDEEFTVELDGKTWTQKPQKYHARSLAAIQQKYGALADRSAIDPVLEASGCAEILRG